MTTKTRTADITVSCPHASPWCSRYVSCPNAQKTLTSTPSPRKNDFMMKSADLTVAIGLSQGYRDLLRVCLSTIPAEVAQGHLRYGPGEPEELPPNTVLVRPRRHSDNYMRGYVMNVAIRAVDTPYVLLGDADLAFPRYLVDVFSPPLSPKCYDST